MPYADLGGLDRDRRFGALTDLFTVDLVARYVGWKLVGADGGGGPATPGIAALSRPARA